MKWIFVWLGLASLAIAAAAGSCSINHRSGSYNDCDSTRDCDQGQTCKEGLCVAASTPIPDGGVRPDARVPPDAGVCPPQCTSCSGGKICIIDCAAGANCGPQIVCPLGFECDVRCNLDGSCRNGVNCSAATSCTLQCTGRNSCRGVTCGAGACTVNCPAVGSCETVLCGPSCACDVKCGLVSGNCFDVRCTRPECDTGKGCSAAISPSCDTCP
jgi:hypothetical protein